MGCQSTKCAGENCKAQLPACQLTQGLCPNCYAKKKAKQQQDALNKS